MVLVDNGLSELLAAAGQAPMDAESWDDLVSVRWGAAMLSALLGWFAWFLVFQVGHKPMKVPVAGVALGFVGIVGAVWLIWRMYESVNRPEFEGAATVTSDLAFMWSVFLVMIALGCLRMALKSFQGMRGRA